MTAEPFVSRGGLKLRHALDHFRVDVSGLTCADFGCSTGGFTDCLLHAGAAKVYAIDTAYGLLAWKLRKDSRVVVRERQNGLHASVVEPLDLAVADMGWTPQRLLVPAVLRHLKPGDAARFITLIKPHYELKDVRLDGVPRELPKGGVLDDATAHRVTDAVLDRMPEWGAKVLHVIRSPILGGAVGGGAAPGPDEGIGARTGGLGAGDRSGGGPKVKGAGNAEWLALIARA